MFHAVVLCCMHLCLTAVAVEGDSKDETVTNDSAEESNWRTSVRCGVNVAYVYLKLKGYTVDYDETLGSLPIGEDGTNLEDLRKFVDSHDSGSVVVRASPSELSQFALPVIAHLEEDTSSLFQSEDTGHYVVVVGVLPERETFVDGTSGAIRTMRSDLFFRAWSGYLILSRPSTFDLTLFLFLICICLPVGWLAGAGIQKLFPMPRTKYED